MAGVADTSVQLLEATESAGVEYRLKPLALVVQVSNTFGPATAAFNVGITLMTCGGVTLAQLVPMRNSSAVSAEGSSVVLPFPRRKKIKLAITLLPMSPPETVVNVGVGVVAEPKVERSGLIHMLAVSSVVEPVL